MTAPTHVQAGQVWLGRYTDDAHTGYLDVLGVMAPSSLAIIDRKVVTGPTDPDADRYISSWIIDSFAGGGQVEEMNVQQHGDRYWTGFGATRFPRQIALGHLVHEERPSWADADTEAFALGDVYAESTGRARTFYAAFGVEFGGYNASTGAWYDKSGTDLAFEPVRPGVPFKGTGSNTYLFVPFGHGNGYAIISEGAAGEPNITNVADDSTHPGAVAFCPWDNKLYAIDGVGQLWSTLDGSTWVKVQSNVASDLILDGSREPRTLVVGVNKVGDPTLFIVTDMDVWAYDSGSGLLHLTNINDSGDPDFGRDAIMWRAGEDLWIAYGMDTLRITGSMTPVPNMGISRDDGVPARYRGHIVSFAKTNESLWALVAGAAAPIAQENVVEAGAGGGELTVPDGSTYATIYEWNGSGWHGLWASERDDNTPNWMVASRLSSDRRVWWGGSDGFLRNFKVRSPFRTPWQGFSSGIDEYAVTVDLESSRFDGGMTAFDKIAEGAVIDLRHATALETVQINYRTNADWLADGSDPGYPHLLGTATEPDMTYFPFNPNGDEFAEGQVFNWLQYRWRLRRRTEGSGAELLTPIIRSFSTHYIQRPQDVKAFTWRISLPPEAFIGHGGASLKDRLDDLIESRELLCLVHGDRQYRGYLSSVTGGDALGPDPQGERTIAFLEIPTKDHLNG